MGYGGMYGGINGLESGFFKSSLLVLESTNFMINSLSQMTRNMEANAQGFRHFYDSAQNLGKRIKSPFQRAFYWFRNLAFKLVLELIYFLRLKKRP